jgi:hypothetical protein
MLHHTTKYECFMSKQSQFPKTSATSVVIQNMHTPTRSGYATESSSLECGFYEPYCLRQVKYVPYTANITTHEP